MMRLKRPTVVTAAQHMALEVVMVAAASWAVRSREAKAAEVAPRYYHILNP